MVGAEPSQARLLGEDRELSAVVGEGLQLGEHRRLSRAIHLHGAVAAGSHLQREPSLRGARQRRHHRAHTLADAQKGLEPVGVSQLVRLGWALRSGRRAADAGAVARPRS